jgi:small subunit ribosomal protein S8
MLLNDPVGDMLTRLRNGSRAHHEKVVLPSSKLKLEILRVLKEEGFIADYLEHERKPQNEITVVLKYGPERAPVLAGVKRISKPGIRRYVPVRGIPRVLGGLGISILSTSRGVMVDHEARKQNVGGEIICTVY